MPTTALKLNTLYLNSVPLTTLGGSLYLNGAKIALFSDIGGGNTDVVYTTGNQIINGLKTFTNIRASGATYFYDELGCKTADFSVAERALYRNKGDNTPIKTLSSQFGRLYDSTGVLGLDWFAGDLYGSGGYKAANYRARTLNAYDGSVALEWHDNTNSLNISAKKHLIGMSGVTFGNQYGTAFYLNGGDWQTLSLNGESQINIGLGYLSATNNDTLDNINTLTWGSGFLNRLLDGSTTVNWFDSQLIKSGDKSLDWDIKVGYGAYLNADGSTGVYKSFDWQSQALHSYYMGGNIYASGITNPSVDYQNNILYNYNGTSNTPSVRWGARTLDTVSYSAVDWGNSYLYRAAGSLSYNWQNNYIYESGNNVAIKVRENQILTNNDLVIDWNVLNLYPRFLSYVGGIYLYNNWKTDQTPTGQFDITNKQFVDNYTQISYRTNNVNLKATGKFNTTYPVPPNYIFNLDSIETVCVNATSPDVTLGLISGSFGNQFNTSLFSAATSIAVTGFGNRDIVDYSADGISGTASGTYLTVQTSKASTQTGSHSGVFIFKGSLIKYL